MRFRKLFKSMLLWRRAIIARRLYKRALKELTKLKLSQSAQLEKQREKYERLLTIERTRFRLLHTEWANRFLQHNGKAGISNALVGIEDVIDSEYLDDQGQEDTGLPLSKAEEALLMDTKDRFYEDGKIEGKSDFEIERYWQDLLPKITEDIRSNILK